MNAHEVYSDVVNITKRVVTGVAIGVLASSVAVVALEHRVGKKSPVRYDVRLAWTPVDVDAPGFKQEGINIYRQMVRREAFVEGHYTNYDTIPLGPPVLIDTHVKGTNYTDSTPKLRGRTYAYTAATVVSSTNGDKIEGASLLSGPAYIDVPSEIKR